MRANRRRDTKPEKLLASELHRRGLRFRRDLFVRSNDVRTHVDIAFPARRCAVFVMGCFWHRCPLHGTDPKLNPNYWGPKLDRNVERDRRIADGLSADGWRVITVWEHEHVIDAADRVESVVRSITVG